MKFSRTTRSLVATAALVLSVALSACASANQQSSGSTTATPQSASAEAVDQQWEAQVVTIQMAGPVSPPSIPMLKMVEDQTLGKDVTLEFASWTTPDELTGYITGGYDFIAAPLTTGATLFNKGIGIQQLNVSAWDVMDLITTDPAITSLADLEGKTVYIAMKGSAVDYSTQVVLKANGLVPGENVTLEYVAPTEGMPQLMAGTIDTLVTVEPQVTAALSQSKDAHSVFDFKEQWQKATESTEKLPTAGVLVADDFAAESPQLAQAFEAEYAKAAKWVEGHPDEAAALAEKHLGLQPEVFARAVPSIDWTVEDAQTARPAVDLYFGTLFALAPESVGGQVPSDAFYFTGN